MKVLVAGSLRHLDSEKAEEFKSACRQIGRRLADARVEIVVGSDQDHTADYHSVHGALDSESQEIALTIVRPRPDHVLFEDIRNSDPRLRIRVDDPVGRWWTVRGKQVDACDVVLLMGGAGGTRDVAEAALQLGKPILPISYFEGAAAQVRADNRFDWSRLNAEDWKKADGPWSDNPSAKEVLDLLSKLANSVDEDGEWTFARFLVMRSPTAKFLFGVTATAVAMLAAGILGEFGANIARWMSERF